MTKTIDVLCLGEPLAEFNQDADDGRFSLSYGGDTSNVAIAAARAGARAGYVSLIGDDVFGDGLLALWAQEGVDMRGVSRRSDAPTGVYVVTHGKNGHQFTYLRAGSAASRMTVADVPHDLIADCRILHVSGISQAISESAAQTVRAAMKAARRAGAWICYDTNFRPRLWPLEVARPVIHAAMAEIDIARASLDDARLLTGRDTPQDIIAFYRNLGARIIALTLGADGAVVAGPEGDVTRLPACPVTFRDATGAGDAFTGNFLARLAAGDAPATAARFANAAAALSTRAYGAVNGLPRQAETEAYLDEIM